MRLKDKVAIVTGAGSGNGAAIANGFLKEGALVVFADVKLDDARAMAEQSGSPADRWMAIHVDVAKADSVQALVAATVARFGRLDIMVNNAGITIRKPFLEMTEEEYDRVMDVNSKGVFLGSQEAGRVMARQGGGVIIQMSSVSAITAAPNVVQYGASKGAVASMTRHMAIDLAPYNIRVNAIGPGTIRTNLNKERLAVPDQLQATLSLTPMNRVGTPEELVGAAVFLASEDSSFVTGAHIFIDGGYTIR